MRQEDEQIWTAERVRLLELAERLRTTTDQAELQQIKSELARMVFGDPDT